MRKRDMWAHNTGPSARWVGLQTARQGAGIDLRSRKSRAGHGWARLGGARPVRRLIYCGRGLECPAQQGKCRPAG